MADRVVKVTLTATVADYKRGMMEAAEATRKVGTQAEKLAQTREAMQTLGSAGMVMGATLAAGIGVAAAKFAEFDQAMSNVAATGDDARDNLGALRDAAVEAGASTVFSATEAANAIEEMAKAGVSAKDILGGGLTGALDLAAAGGLDVASAAGIAATTLQQFQLKGSDASHVADLLAAGAGKAMGEVSDLSGALAQSGLVANQFGISVDETVGTLAAFASAGMLGSDSGTSFRTMLLRLANPTGEAATKMEELGIQAYDASGKFVGMAGLAGQLESGLAGLTQEQQNAALAIIFGQDAIRGANVLLEEGAAGIADWTAKVNDQGYAAETAATRLDNLAGDWEKLTGAMDTAFIIMGEGANGPLRWLIQGLTGLVDGFNGLPDWAQQAALGAGLLAAGIGLVGGAVLLAIPKIAALRVAMVDLNITGGSARAGLSRFASFLGGPWFLAIGAAITVIGSLAAAQADARAKAEAYADTLVDSAERVTDATRDMVVENLSAADSFLWLENKSALDNAESLGLSLETVTDAAMGNAEALKELAAMQEKLNDADKSRETRAYNTEAHERAEAINAVVDAVKGENASIDEAIRLADQKAAADGGAADASSVAASAFGEQDAAARALEESLAAVVQQLDDIAGTVMSMAEAKDSALSAINSMREAADAEGVSLDGTNDASIRFRDSIREVEQAHRDSAQAIIENGGTLEEAQGAWAAGRQAVIDMLVAKGMDTEAAAAWADANLGSASAVSGALAGVKSAVDSIPEKKHIRITVDASEAMRGVDQFIREASGRVIRVRVAADGGSISYNNRVLSPEGNAAGGFYSGGVKAFADGGFEPGMYRYTPGGIHKFAEEWDEAYLSGDPRRRTRTEKVWVRAGQEWGFQMPGQAAPEIHFTHKGDIVTVDPDSAFKRQQELFRRAIAAMPLT